MTMETMTAREAPQGKPLPWVGHLLHVAHHGMWDFLAKEQRERGDYFRLTLGPRQMFVIAHPDGVERVLGTNRDNYIKKTSYDSMRLLTGDGLLTLEGDTWRTRRRMANPAFHRESIRRFVRSISGISQEALAAWRWRIPNGGTLDLHHEMMLLTLEVVAETLFGQRMGEAAGDTSGRAFAEALKVLSDRGNTGVRLPLHIPTPGNLRFRRILQTLDTEVYRILDAARKETEPRAVPTLVHMLLQARDEDTGQGLTDRELRNELMTLFLAGHETTALLLTWLFTLLSRSPQVVERAEAEVDAVLSDREPTSDDVPKLVYLRQIIDEALRLRPPAWSIARDTVADDVIGGFHVRAGDLVLPAIYLVQRHPAFWPHPERFDPDRFAPDRAKSRHHYAYLPFSLGPRICIGNIFALTEATVMLATLLQHTRISMDAPDAVRIQAGITLRPSGPVPVRVRWRRSRAQA